ncbi:ABC transporter substrate-binding protein [Oceanobacillus neutriphilus]|uniref:Metal ABC transporter substrate-binding protein n=1 Tax=Oceanobacillus neutriphilus TaxID=531815 RepID=A0ABQ2NU66_9BACI|nr:ABC transporter substrate-binding protein [Oceanobacillus neutriphilus]GGP10647.1 metal ABC transporter substrate-binding protein [Oceanobacillus neutriphilus]
MNKRLIRFMTAIFTVFVLLTACSAEEEREEGDAEEASTAEEKVNDENETVYPLEIEVTDAKGNTYTQTFEQAPERIITNNLSSIEVLLELGLKDKIVGTTQPDNEVTGEFADDVNDIPVIGDKMTVSKETVAEYTPEIVVGREMSFNDESMGSVSTLNDLGIQTYIQTASNMTSNPPLTAVIDDVLTLGQIFDVNERAEEYAKELEERYQAVIDQAEKNKDEEELTLMPIVAYDSSNSSFAIFNISGGLQGDLLNQLNVVPAIEGSSADPSLETIISTNPDIIVYVEADRNAELDANAVESIMNEPLLQEVNAVKENRVYTTTYDDFMDYGPRIFNTFEMLGDNLYGN